MRLLTPFLLTLPLFSTTFALPGPSPPGDENDGKNEHQTSKYDYVVVGSGPGGGPLANTLARAGHSVFLIEAGGDESHDISTELDSLFLLAGAANTSWGFYVSHYQDLETTLRYNLLTWKQTNGSLFVGTDPPEGAKMLGVYYPRGATLGGSAITNAKCVSLPSASDWDQIADLTGEEGWRAPTMREVFKRIERNVFVPADAPGHGFDGWLTVNQGSLAPYRTEALRNVYGALAEALGEDFDSAYELLQRDANSADLERDFVQGMYGLAFHVDEVWRRVSPRDILLPTANDAQFMLHLQLNSLATRVLLDRKKQRAIGVEYIEGVGIYGADRRYDPTQEPPEVKKVFARKEVIVAGGAFNSPQLLQLSGIGDCAHLEAVGVECLVHLPGVGRNLQENYEFPIVGTARTAAITDPSPCTGGAPGDPCLEEWIANKTGPYADAGANSNSIMLKTADAPRGERDVLVFTIAGGAFRGFVPPEFSNSLPPDAPSVFDMSTVKIHPGNKAGSVRIRSNDPREPPEIQFNFFSQGGEADLDALEEVVAWSRRALMAVPEPYGPFGNLEPPCPAGVDMETGYCADRQQDRDWIVDQAFGHHPTSTCPMGREDDPMAVLDGRLRLRGVDGLRVVDASAFPNIPGAFPVLPTFMLSQKAGEFILEELEKEKEPE